MESPTEPYTNLLIAVKARQLADWAIGHESRRERLHAAIQRGCKTVLELAIQVSPLTLDDLRRLHTVKSNILGPLVLKDLYRARGRNSMRWKSFKNPFLALTVFWTYCDLFHHSISQSYRPSPEKPLSSATRLNFIKSCGLDLEGRGKLLEMLNGFGDNMDVICLQLKLVDVEYDEDGLTWLARCALHTGLPALGLIRAYQAREEVTATPEVIEVKENIQNMATEGVDFGPLLIGGEWNSLANDIRDSWNV
ncbi:hypothetical protein FRB96_002660 [Tulasnella sp. 330]|nr:hypothetical protein FRB96_002660 [Tulasnella sp. 330]